MLCHLEDLWWLGTLIGLEGLGVLEEAGGIGSLTSDSILKSLVFHGLEVWQTLKEVHSLARGVLGHLAGTELASYLGELLRTELVVGQGCGKDDGRVT